MDQNVNTLDDMRKSELFLSFQVNELNKVSVSYSKRWDVTPPDNFYIPETHDGRKVEVLDLCNLLPDNATSIYIPGTINDIKLNEWNIAPALRHLSISPENETYWSDGNALYTKNREKLLRLLNVSLEEYHVAEGTRILGEKAFVNCEVLRKVVLPDTVEKLEKAVFNVGLRQGVKRIDREVIGIEKVRFDDISSVAQTTFYRDNPNLISYGVYIICREIKGSSYTVPQGIEKIGRACFCRYSGEDQDTLEELILPDSVRTIGENAFEGNRKLKNIKLSENLENIPKGAFNGCDALETLYVPASVKEFSLFSLPENDKALGSNASMLKEIIVSDNNANYCSTDGILFTKDKKTLLFVPRNLAIKKYTVPNGVEHIMDYAFANNRHLEEIEISESVQSIGEYAFAKCKKLNTVSISQAQTIGTGAFTGCQELKRVVMPSTLRSIGDWAFKECQSLHDISLPEGVESIGSDAFAKCEFPKVVIPKSVRQIGKGSFWGSKEIVIYDTIDPDAKACDSAIDYYNCKPNSSVGVIGIDTWAITRKLNHVWHNHRIIVKSAETDKIKCVVNMESDSSQRQYYSFLLSAWGHNASFALSKLDEFFPKISGGEYKLRVALSRLKYPVDLSAEKKTVYEKYVTKVAKDAIKSCIDDDDMTLLDQIKAFGAIKPQYAEELIEYANKTGKTVFAAWLMDYQNANPVKSKKKDNLSLDDLPKPRKTKPVDKTSDAYMKKVWGVSTDSRGRNLITSYKGEDTEIVFPKEVLGKRISGIASRKAFPAIYEKLLSVVIPEGYEEIGGSAFAGCKMLKKVVLPQSVESIGDNAFSGCESLERIILPAKVRHIGKWTFRDCYELKDVFILNEYLNIEGKAVFRGCNKFVVHAPTGATIERSVKGKHFAPVKRGDASEFVKAYFSEPLSGTVILNERALEKRIGDINDYLLNISDENKKESAISKAKGIIPQVGDKVHFDGALVFLGDNLCGEITSSRELIMQYSSYLEGTVVTEIQVLNDESKTKVFDIEIEMK